MPIPKRSTQRTVTQTTSASREEDSGTSSRSPFKSPRLIGSLCTACGAYTFPKQSICPHCRQEEMEEVYLSNRGRLETFAILRHALPGYEGPVPYAVGAVTLPEGVKIRGLVGGCHPEELRQGMEVEWDFVKVGVSHTGIDMLAQAFRPV